MDDRRELAVFATELGWMGLGWDGSAAVRLVIDCRSPDEVVRRMEAGAGGTAWRERERWRGALAEAVDRLRRYAAGEPAGLDRIPVALEGTDFQRRVWVACRAIRYGETVSYGELARRAGVPGAARGVGRAMAANRLPVVIPCHRVLAAGGGMGGYSAPGGLALKERLLALEGTEFRARGRRLDNPQAAG